MTSQKQPDSSYSRIDISLSERDFWTNASFLVSKSYFCNLLNSSIPTLKETLERLMAGCSNENITTMIRDVDKNHLPPHQKTLCQGLKLTEDVPVFLIACETRDSKNHRQGVFIKNYDDGHQARLIALYINNHIEGPCYEFYPDGITQCKTHFKGGVLEGERETFFKNGKQRSLENYENGQLEGPATKFTLEGNSVNRFRYLRGKKHGWQETQILTEGSLACLFSYYTNGVLKGQGSNKYHVTENILRRNANNDPGSKSTMLFPTYFVV